MFEARLNILKLLSEHEGTPLASRDIVHLLALSGQQVAERTVRYHLKLLEEGGQVEPRGKSGRHITTRGRDTVERTFGSESGFVRNRFYNMACLTDIDPACEGGTVIVSTVSLSMDSLPRALALLRAACGTPLMTGERILLVPGGQRFGRETVPPGRAILGVLNAATSLGVMVRSGIPALPAYIGLLEYADAAVRRFSSIIGLQAASEDVLSLYVTSGLTRVTPFLKQRDSLIVGLFLDMPSVCYEQMRELADNHALINVIELGVPGSRLLDVAVESARVGAVISDGMNALALLREAGIALEHDAQMVPVDSADLLRVNDAARRYC